MRAKAAVLYQVGQPVVIEEITVEPPRRGEVLVRMEAAGVCHSDLHVRDGAIPEPLPIVLGHEGAGTVAQIGEGVTGLQKGDRVKIPQDVPIEVAALLGCAVVTGVGAVERTAGVRPGESVAVIGCGGVGLNVVQAASLAGAYPVIAIDVRADKLELARRVGASHGVNVREENVAEAVQAITGYGVDWAFEVLGNPRAIEQAWGLIRAGGTVVVVGLAPKGSTVTLPAFDFISEKNIRGCFYGSTRFRADVPVILQRIQAGRIKIDSMISHSAQLEELEDAFARLKSGDGVRTVLRF